MKTLLNKRRNKKSKNTNNYMPVGLTNKMKKFIGNTDEHLVDLYQVYLDEKDASDKYRLIFTLNPVCTNALFNAITEVVKDEGSHDCEVLTDTPITPDKVTYPNIISNEKITRIQAIRDTEYSNENIQPQPQGTMVNGYPMEMGVDVGYRLPLFDIEVTAEKQSPYTKMAHNEMALQFYSAGFFNPQNSDAALACLDMMDFDRKDFVTQKIEQNGTLLRMLQRTQMVAIQLAQQLDAEHGTMLAEEMAQQFEALTGGAIPGSAAPGKAAAQRLEGLGGSNRLESGVTRRARTQAAQASAPR